MSKDRRLEKSCGFFSNREALTKAIFELKGTMSSRDIGDEVGVSPATVSRIINGDVPTYTRSKSAVVSDSNEGINAALLNKYWIIPQSTLE